MMTETNPPKNIIIVGGGTAGWMAASILMQSLGKYGSKITLIESDNVPVIGVGEGTTPLFKQFLHYLNIPEHEFMSKCNATYKHGISFPDWTQDDEEFSDYFHPFNSPGYNHNDDVFFSNCNKRRNKQQVDTDSKNYFFGAELAKQRKAPVGPSPLNSDNIGYAYHFDASLLAELLKGRCLKEGITHIVDDVTKVALNKQQDITQLVLTNDKIISGDFFIDCTGFARKLIKEALNVKLTSYENKLFNNSAVVIRTPTSSDEITPYTESRALKNGWAWRIPLSDRVGWGYVYSNNYTSAQEAEQELRELIGTTSNDLLARHINFKVGRVNEHWKNNCFAVGLSQGFIEPLEATALGLVQFGLIRFVSYFDKGNYQPTYRDHFNKIVNEAFDSTCEYIQMHYKLNTREDSQYWCDNRDNSHISDSSRTLIAGWDSSQVDFNDVLAQHSNTSTYPPYSWYCILSGMGRYPKETKKGLPANNENPFQKEVSRYYGHREFLTSGLYNDI